MGCLSLEGKLRYSSFLQSNIPDGRSAFDQLERPTKRPNGLIRKTRKKTDGLTNLIGL